mgnify:FL=1
MKKTDTVQQSLNNNKVFIQSDFYCVINPGLSHFNQDQIISHNDLLIFFKNNNFNTITIIPHLS